MTAEFVSDGSSINPIDPKPRAYPFDESHIASVTRLPLSPEEQSRRNRVAMEDFRAYRSLRTIIESSRRNGVADQAGRSQRAVEQAREEDMIHAVQLDVGEWITNNDILEGTDYGSYSKELVDSRLGELLRFLTYNCDSVVSDGETIATELFVRNAFEMYEGRNRDGSRNENANGSFAFIVHPRMSKKNDYGSEIETIIPALRYVPIDLRAQMMVGLPPFILDAYKESDGKQGYLICAPVYLDMFDEVKDGRRAQKIANEHAQNSADFAVGRLGVEYIGWGAIMPRVTFYGKNVDTTATSTTGHAGTLHFMLEEEKMAFREGFVGNTTNPTSGFLGAGYMGGPAAYVHAVEYPHRDVVLFDPDCQKAERTLKAIQGILGRTGVVEIAQGERELLERSDVVMSTATSVIDLEPMEGLELTGKVIIDDAQPGSFHPDQVEDRGGKLLWVIGEDASGGLQRETFGYGDTMAEKLSNVYGCEAEIYAIARMAAEMRSEGHTEDEVGEAVRGYALRGPVQPEDVIRFGKLFKRFGIGVARPQRYGQYVEA